MIVLTADHLQLMSFSASDIDGLVTLFRDPGVRKYLWDDVEVARGVVVEVVEASEAEFLAGRCGMFCLRVPQSPEIIGFCGLRPAHFFEAPANKKQAQNATELLYGLLPGYWGQGLAVEACRSLLGYAVEHRHLERVVAATDVPNLASVRVMERLGMDFSHRGLLEGLDTLFYSFSHDSLQNSANRS